MKESEEFRRNLTARIDIKLLGSGNLKLISASDNKAKITQPTWLQTNGSGYVVESLAARIKLIFKTDINGQIKLWLRGLDVHDKKDKSKRIPYWIDFTDLNVNGKTIFDKVTPVWHNEPYIYNIDAKNGYNIELEFQWQPHK